MVGIVYIKRAKEIIHVSIIKAFEKDIIKMNHEGFLFFNKKYAVSEQIGLSDILEMEDDFIEFISDIESFVTLNIHSIEGVADIIDSFFPLDESSEKDVLTLARDYRIKVDYNQENDSAYLVKVLLMVFKKKLNKEMPIKTVLPQLHNEEDITVNETVDNEVHLDFEGLIIDGVPYVVNFNKNYGLSENGKKLFDVLKCYSNLKEEIVLDKLIIEKCTNFRVFFTLLLEFSEKGVFSLTQYTELKESYFRCKENERYQKYLKDSILKGIDISILKEQVDLYYFLKL